MGVHLFGTNAYWLLLCPSPRCYCSRYICFEPMLIGSSSVLLPAVIAPDISVLNQCLLAPPLSFSPLLLLKIYLFGTNAYWLLLYPSPRCYCSRYICYCLLAPPLDCSYLFGTNAYWLFLYPSPRCYCSRYICLEPMLIGSSSILIPAYVKVKHPALLLKIYLFGTNAYWLLLYPYPAVIAQDISVWNQCLLAPPLSLSPLLLLKIYLFGTNAYWLLLYPYPAVIAQDISVWNQCLLALPLSFSPLLLLKIYLFGTNAYWLLLYPYPHCYCSRYICLEPMLIGSSSILTLLLLLKIYLFGTNAYWLFLYPYPAVIAQDISVWNQCLLAPPLSLPCCYCSRYICLEPMLIGSSSILTPAVIAQDISVWNQCLLALPLSLPAVIAQDISVWNQCLLAPPLSFSPLLLLKIYLFGTNAYWLFLYPYPAVIAQDISVWNQCLLAPPLSLPCCYCSRYICLEPMLIGSSSILTPLLLLKIYLFGTNAYWLFLYPYLLLLLKIYLFGTNAYWLLLYPSPRCYCSRYICLEPMLIGSSSILTLLLLLKIYLFGTNAYWLFLYPYPAVIAQDISVWNQCLLALPLSLPRCYCSRYICLEPMLIGSSSILLPAVIAQDISVWNQCLLAPPLSLPRCYCSRYICLEPMLIGSSSILTCCYCSRYICLEPMLIGSSSILTLLLLLKIYLFGTNAYWLLLYPSPCCYCSRYICLEPMLIGSSSILLPAVIAQDISVWNQCLLAPSILTCCYCSRYICLEPMLIGSSSILLPAVIAQDISVWNQCLLAPPLSFSLLLLLKIYLFGTNAYWLLLYPYPAVIAQDISVWNQCLLAPPLSFSPLLLLKIYLFGTNAYWLLLYPSPCCYCSRYICLEPMLIGSSSILTLLLLLKIYLFGTNAYWLLLYPYPAVIAQDISVWNQCLLAPPLSLPCCYCSRYICLEPMLIGSSSILLPAVIAQDISVWNQCLLAPPLSLPCCYCSRYICLEPMLIGSSSILLPAVIAQDISVWNQCLLAPPLSLPRCYCSRYICLEPMLIGSSSILSPLLLLKIYLFGTNAYWLLLYPSPRCYCSRYICLEPMLIGSSSILLPAVIAQDISVWNQCLLAPPLSFSPLLLLKIYLFGTNAYWLLLYPSPCCYCSRYICLEPMLIGSSSILLPAVIAQDISVWNQCLLAPPLSISPLLLLKIYLFGTNAYWLLLYPSPRCYCSRYICLEPMLIGSSSILLPAVIAQDISVWNQCLLAPPLSFSPLLLLKIYLFGTNAYWLLLYPSPCCYCSRYICLEPMLIGSSSILSPLLLLKIYLFGTNAYWLLLYPSPCCYCSRYICLEPMLIGSSSILLPAVIAQDISVWNQCLLAPPLSFSPLLLLKIYLFGTNAYWLLLYPSPRCYCSRYICLEPMLIGSSSILLPAVIAQDISVWNQCLLAPPLSFSPLLLLKIYLFGTNAYWLLLYPFPAVIAQDISVWNQCLLAPPLSFPRCYCSRYICLEPMLIGSSSILTLLLLLKIYLFGTNAYWLLLYPYPAVIAQDISVWNQCLLAPPLSFSLLLLLKIYLFGTNAYWLLLYPSPCCYCSRYICLEPMLIGSSSILLPAVIAQDISVWNQCLLAPPLSLPCCYCSRYICLEPMLIGSSSILLPAVIAQDISVWNQCLLAPPLSLPAVIAQDISVWNQCLLAPPLSFSSLLLLKIYLFGTNAYWLLLYPSPRCYCSRYICLEPMLIGSSSILLPTVIAQDISVWNQCLLAPPLSFSSLLLLKIYLFGTNAYWLLLYPYPAVIAQDISVWNQCLLAPPLSISPLLLLKISVWNQCLLAPPLSISPLLLLKIYLFGTNAYWLLLYPSPHCYCSRYICLEPMLIGSSSILLPAVIAQDISVWNQCLLAPPLSFSLLLLLKIYLFGTNAYWLLLYPSLAVIAQDISVWNQCLLAPPLSFSPLLLLKIYLFGTNAYWLLLYPSPCCYCSRYICLEPMLIGSSSILLPAVIAQDISVWNQCLLAPPLSISPLLLLKIYLFGTNAYWLLLYPSPCCYCSRYICLEPMLIGSSSILLLAVIAQDISVWNQCLLAPPLSFSLLLLLKIYLFGTNAYWLLLYPYLLLLLKIYLFGTNAYWLLLYPSPRCYCSRYICLEPMLIGSSSILPPTVIAQDISVWNQCLLAPPLSLPCCYCSRYICLEPMLIGSSSILLPAVIAQDISVWNQCLLAPPLSFPPLLLLQIYLFGTNAYWLLLYPSPRFIAQDISVWNQCLLAPPLSFSRCYCSRYICLEPMLIGSSSILLPAVIAQDISVWNQCLLALPLSFSPLLLLKIYLFGTNAYWLLLYLFPRCYCSRYICLEPMLIGSSSILTCCYCSRYICLEPMLIGSSSILTLLLLLKIYLFGTNAYWLFLYPYLLLLLKIYLFGTNAYWLLLYPSPRCYCSRYICLEPMLIGSSSILTCCYCSRYICLEPMLIGSSSILSPLLLLKIYLFGTNAYWLLLYPSPRCYCSRYICDCRSHSLLSVFPIFCSMPPCGYGLLQTIVLYGLLQTIMLYDTVLAPY